MLIDRRHGGSSPEMESLGFEASHPLETGKKKQEPESEALRSVTFEKQHPSRFSRGEEHPDIQALRFEVKHQKNQEVTPEQARAMLKKAGLKSDRNGLENLFKALR